MNIGGWFLAIVLEVLLVVEVSRYHVLYVTIETNNQQVEHVDCTSSTSAKTNKKSI